MIIYDIIHGNIEICPLAEKIINTEEFQRLRNIKQLGCCNYVFPSATHTRFEHSIGVYHLSKKYIDILSKNNDNYFTDKDKKCIIIGGLIHDLGHGPYSHLFDEVVSKDINHEYRSIKMFEFMNQKYNLNFNDDELNMIKNIIDPKNAVYLNDKKYIYQIVSNMNGIDVDRFDYIMRDIKMTGLNYGIEYERIMNHSKIVNGEIQFLDKVKTNVEDFYRIRMIMYEEVYNHHTVRSIEYMMKKYIQKLDILLGISEIIELEEWEKYIKLSDNIINITPFLPKSDKINELKEIVQNINERKIYKLIGEIISDDKINHNIVKVLGSYDNIIIDSIKLSYYGKEKCKFIKNNKIIDNSNQQMNKDKYKVTVYCKDDNNIDEIMELFETLRL